MLKSITHKKPLHIPHEEQGKRFETFSIFSWVIMKCSSLNESQKLFILVAYRLENQTFVIGA
jgi:hypothetical protein